MLRLLGIRAIATTRPAANHAPAARRPIPAAPSPDASLSSARPATMSASAPPPRPPPTAAPAAVTLQARRFELEGPPFDLHRFAPRPEAARRLDVIATALAAACGGTERPAYDNTRDATRRLNLHAARAVRLASRA